MRFFFKLGTNVVKNHQLTIIVIPNVTPQDPSDFQRPSSPFRILCRHIMIDLKIKYCDMRNEIEMILSFSIFSAANE